MSRKNAKVLYGKTKQDCKKLAVTSLLRPMLVSSFIGTPKRKHFAESSCKIDKG